MKGARSYQLVGELVKRGVLRVLACLAGSYLPALTL